MSVKQITLTILRNTTMVKTIKVSKLEKDLLREAHELHTSESIENFEYHEKLYTRLNRRYTRAYGFPFNPTLYFKAVEPEEKEK